jgi:methionyl aminopeptidase
MISIKTPKELEIMKKSGHILAETLCELEAVLKPGMTELELDKLAEELIIKKGGQSGFKKVPGYNYTLCVSTNDEVVHGIPTNYAFREGDLIGIDCGVYLDGFFTDMAETIKIPNGKKDESDKFLSIGKKALDEAIKIAKAENRVGHISKTIQDIVEGNGYSIVQTLVGHGVGKKLHEEPEIPGFVWGEIKDTPVLKPGMTLAIEVIYNMGIADVVRTKGDDWTIKTKDGSLSSTFERTIAVANSVPLILTK